MLRLLNNSLNAKKRLSFGSKEHGNQKSKIRCCYDKENLQRAFNATLTGMSVYRASRQYGVPESTLRDRTRGNVAVDAKPGSDTIFTWEEEEQLVGHVKYMASIGYGYTKTNIQYLASDFAASCKKKASPKGHLSDNWFYGLMKRWPELKVAKPQKLSLLRAECASRNVIDNYFKELDSILTLNNLKDKPERIFNMDETGVNTEHSPPKIVCDKFTQPQAVTSPRSSIVTIIGGGNAVGNHIPPYFVFSGKRWSDELLEGAPPGSAGEMSDNGWSNSKIFHNYITNHFAKHANITTDPEAPKTLILFDGHKSHISLTLVDWAKKHNVILFVLPPHTSHITQPLDVAVFGPFKLMYSQECQLFLQRNPGMKITKHDIAKLVSKPYMKAMSPDNLCLAFRKTGVFPFSYHSVIESQVAPSTIYSPRDTEENMPPPENSAISSSSLEPVNTTMTSPTEPVNRILPLSSSDSQLMPSSAPVDIHKSKSSQTTSADQSHFFLQRTIIKAVKKPRKRFVPPFLAGSLLKEKNIQILQSSIKQVPPVNKSKKCVNNNKFVPAPISPKPGPSGVHVDRPTSDEESSVDGDDTENCCVCGKHSPPALRSCPYLVIVKWAQCDVCQHWTHLSFCSKIKFVRRHGTFMCPHCG